MPKANVPPGRRAHRGDAVGGTAGAPGRSLIRPSDSFEDATKAVGSRVGITLRGGRRLTAARTHATGSAGPQTRRGHRGAGRCGRRPGADRHARRVRAGRGGAGGTVPVISRTSAHLTKGGVPHATAPPRPPYPSRPPARAAFFDVDETLIAVKSMFRFLNHHFAVLGRPPSVYAAAVADLRGLVAAGASRAEVTHAYYRLYEGQSSADLAAQGRDWFAREQRTGALFLPHALKAFHGHRRRGDLTVLVSGSFAPCLDPIAEWLGASVVFGARPETVGGVCTGGLVTAMLGRDKAAAARSVMLAHGISPAACHAYGDHVSDLPLLRAVGHPVDVGKDPELVEYATAHGWSRLLGVNESRSAAAATRQRPEER